MSKIKYEWKIFFFLLLLIEGKKKRFFSKQYSIVTKEIDNRVQLAWKRYWSHKVVKNPRVPPKSKKIFDFFILPILTYGCQTWSITKQNMRNLEPCQHSMERSMLNDKLKDKIKLETLLNQTKINEITYCIRKLKWRWAGHMLRSTNNK